MRILNENRDGSKLPLSIKMSKVWRNFITVSCASNLKVNGWKESVFVETILIENLKTDKIIEV